MKYLGEYRDPEVARRLVERIQAESRETMRLMEVCGTHTVAIFRHGIRQLLPPPRSCSSGPGCPVCVTTNADIDKAIALADAGSDPGHLRRHDEGARELSDLQQVKADGSDVRVVYSPSTPWLARDDPRSRWYSSPWGSRPPPPPSPPRCWRPSALGLKNFFLFSAHKLVPPAVRALLDRGRCASTASSAPAM